MSIVRPGNGVLALLASVLVVSGLVFMDIAPAVADYIALVMGLAGLGAAVVYRDTVLAERGWWLLLLALVLLALTLPFVYHGSQDLLPILALAPFLVVPGVAFVVAQSQPLLRPFSLPLLCLFGAVAAALLGLSEYIASGGARVEAGNNPIHYGGIAVLLGFMAVTGLCVGRSPWRLLFLIGPIAGMAAAIMSGSRGPLLGGMAMGVAGMPMLVFWYRRDWAVLSAIVIMVLGVPALALTFGSSMRAVTVVSDLTQMMQNAVTGHWGLASTTTASAGQAAAPAVGAFSDGVRSVMYKAALQQFLDSPIFGHGYGQIMGLARVAFPGNSSLLGLEHLHSDLADFAAIGGLLGLAAYGLILAAPLVNLRFGKTQPTDRVVALGSALLTTGYLALGMTNAMFGVLPQTVLFVVLLGYLIALRRSAGEVSTPLH